MTIRTRVLAGLITAPLTAAYAEPGGDDESTTGRFRYADVQPAGVTTQPEEFSGGSAAYGSAGSRWWTVSAGVAHDFNGSTDTDLGFAYSYFLAKDVEFATEVAGWYFNQTGENAHGASLAMTFRWHFINTGPWTVYGDVGIGFLVASDVVPEGGTSFNLMPQGGVGFTRALTDSGLRLQMGVRWHHISNARIHGEANNPARDQPMLYAGIVFPF
jgi:hypothetical protein